MGSKRNRASGEERKGGWREGGREERGREGGEREGGREEDVEKKVRVNVKQYVYHVLIIPCLLLSFLCAPVC